MLAITTALVIVATTRAAGALETTALVLAVVAFASQLLIFVAQLSLSTNQLQQAERVNSETSAVLADVSSRVARLDETQLQQFTEIRERLLPRAVGEQMVDSIDRTVDDLAKTNPSIAAELERRLADLRKTIESKTEREYSAERVQCPYCPNPNVVVRIGSEAGDSAFETCEECGNRFHVHRDGDRRVFTVKPGSAQNTTSTLNDPEQILGRNQMQLPAAQERRNLLGQFIEEWRDGRIRTAHDVTAWMTYPSRVRTPFFFALVNHEYGELILTGDKETRTAERRVEPIPQDFDQSEWTRKAHAGWIAQALFRLRGWGRTREQELLFFFGPDATDDDVSLLQLAHDYDDLVPPRSGGPER